MKCRLDATREPAACSALMFLTFTLAIPFIPPCAALALPLLQTESSKPGESRSASETYRTIYLTNITEQNELGNIQTDLRAMVPHAKIYLSQTQKAISVQGTGEEIQLAQKIIADLDRPMLTYRVIYTITETDSGKRLGAQSLSLVVTSGEKTWLKQGTRVPVSTLTYDAAHVINANQYQYQDVGLNIEATLDGAVDGLRLHSRVDQSSLAEEKPTVGAQNPVIRQTNIDAVSALILGKPLVIGTLDIPSTTRKQEIEVVVEAIK
jgi:type II secretory pathway component GspD/PulD (secretin)